MGRITRLLCELSEEEYHRFAVDHPYAIFLNSVYAGRRMRKNQWDVVYIGMKYDNELIAAAMLVSKSIHVGKYFYAPRGFLIDYGNQKVVKEFTDLLVQYMKKKKDVYLKFDPFVIYQKRDENGNPQKGNTANDSFLHQMEKLGFHPMERKRGYDNTTQCRWISILNLENQ